MLTEADIKAINKVVQQTREKTVQIVIKAIRAKSLRFQPLTNDLSYDIMDSHKEMEMAKWTYEKLEETMGLIWEGYMHDEVPQEYAEMMVESALVAAGWSAEEYDTEVVARSVDKPGCRRIVERGTN